jgi:molybdate transport system ATP-binding protein
MPVVAGRIGGQLAPDLRRAVALVGFEQQRRLLEQAQLRDLARAFSHRPEPDQTIAERFGLCPAADGGDGRRPEALLSRPMRGRSVAQLSSGELHRLLIVQALRRSPALLALDEPFTGLDGAGRRELAALLREAMRRGVTLVLASHRPEEVPAGVEFELTVRNGAVAAAGRRGTASRPAPAGFACRAVPPAARPGISGPAAPEPAAPPLAELRHVTLRYGETLILRDLSWIIRPAEHWAVLGPNGAGKSTLLRLLAADHPQAYANQVYLFGRRRGSGESIWELRRQVAWLTPELQLAYPPGWSAEAVVLSGFFGSRGLYQRPHADQRAAATRCIDGLGLAHLARRPLERMSVGEARLVLLARAMVCAPRLLLLDEPCDGLDQSNRQLVLETVERIGRAGTTQLVFVTHLPDELPACITHRLELRPAAGGGFTAAAVAGRHALTGLGLRCHYAGCSPRASHSAATAPPGIVQAGRQTGLRP